MEIKNYKIYQFLALEADKISEYMDYLSCLNPKNSIVVDRYRIGLTDVTNYRLHAPSVWDMKFKEVDQLKTLLSSSEDENILKAVSLVFKISIQQVYMLSIIDFFSALNYITKEVLNVVTAEKNSAIDNADQKLQACNVKRLDKFKSYNVIDNLADGDVLKWDSIQELPYRIVFTKTYKDTITNDINRIYAQQK